MLAKIAYGPIGRGRIGKLVKDTPLGSYIKGLIASKVVTNIIRRHVVPFTETTTKTLDLGCGSKPRNPFNASILYGIDSRSDLESHIFESDLSVSPIPFEDNSFDFCTAFDFLEHIPRVLRVGNETKYPFISLMNEIYRVLRPGGLFLHSTPAYPAKEAFQDPTHVNIITYDTFPFYFCNPHLGSKNLGYGFEGSFDLVTQKWDRNIWIVGLLRARK